MSFQVEMSVVVPTEKSRKVFDLDVEDDETDKKPGMGAVAKAEVIFFLI